MSRKNISDAQGHRTTDFPGNRHRLSPPVECFSQDSSVRWRIFHTEKILSMR
jgi:hypothetical protein